MRQAIKEEMGVQKEWYEQTKKVTPETLPEFVRHLIEDYSHDYGTICHACAAAAVAASWAVNHSEQGGISGFQAGAIMWEFIRHWNEIEGPIKLVRYENMLYPQYDYHFDKIISEETWKWLQEQAQIKLNGSKLLASPDVLKHWQSIVDGVVPFGYIVKGE